MVGLVACSSFDAEPAPQADAAPGDGGLEGGSTVDAALATGKPLPSCLVQDAGSAVQITATPEMPEAGAPVVLRATGKLPLTNVEMRLCTPEDQRVLGNAEVAGSDTFTWTFTDPGLPRGTTQVTFWSDTDNDPALGRAPRGALLLEAR